MPKYRIELESDEPVEQNTWIYSAFDAAYRVLSVEEIPDPPARKQLTPTDPAHELRYDGQIDQIDRYSCAAPACGWRYCEVVTPSMGGRYAAQIQFDKWTEHGPPPRKRLTVGVFPCEWVPTARESMEGECDQDAVAFDALMRRWYCAEHAPSDSLWIEGEQPMSSVSLNKARGLRIAKRWTELREEHRRIADMLWMGMILKNFTPEEMRDLDAAGFVSRVVAAFEELERTAENAYREVSVGFDDEAETMEELGVALVNIRKLRGEQP